MAAPTRVMALRLQRERMEQGLLALAAASTRACGASTRAARARAWRPTRWCMHPGPMNRGVEIAPDVADGERSVILDQVTNGVAVRCAGARARCAGAAAPRRRMRRAADAVIRERAPLADRRGASTLRVRGRRSIAAPPAPARTART